MAYAIAQISDLHIVAPGELLAGMIDTAAHVRTAVEHLNAVVPRPDAILATGDLVDNGGETEYAHLAELVAPLQAPLWLLPGNHDAVEPLRAVFPQVAPAGSGFVLDGPVRVIGLDSSWPGHPGGRLEQDQLAWLDERLAESSAPTIVALHHPPFATGIRHMDAMGLDPDDAAELGAVVGRHPQVERVQAGHLHRTITRRWCGTIAATAPSVAHAVALDLRDEAPAAWNREPPGYLVHWWTEETGLVTHLEAIGSFPATRYD